jgi:hypothetical protein
VDVTVGTDQCRDLDPIAANIPSEITEDRKCRHYLQLRCLLLRRSRQDRRRRRKASPKQRPKPSQAGFLPRLEGVVWQSTGQIGLKPSSSAGMDWDVTTQLEQERLSELLD